jgi:hypothetical protein
VTVRTLWNWEHARPVVRTGRPRIPDAERLAARRLVAAEWRRQGRSAGAAPVARALAGRVSPYLVRESLREIKRLHAAKDTREADRRRVSTEVLAREVIWSLDATHLGRDLQRAKLEAEFVRDAATTATIGRSVAGPPCGAEVRALLDRTRVSRGGPPLVLATDNGPENVAPEVRAWCHEHAVLLLRNLPRTPRHNPWVEHGHGELKRETGLGRGARICDVARTMRTIDAALERLDACRLRASRGWKTARALDAELPRGYDLVSRVQLRESSVRHTNTLLRCATTARERRLAEREGVLAALEEHGLIRRTRGGAR